MTKLFAMLLAGLVSASAFAAKADAAPDEKTKSIIAEAAPLPMISPEHLKAIQDEVAEHDARRAQAQAKQAENAGQAKSAKPSK